MKDGEVMVGYLVDKTKSKCFGCEACVQVCPKDAICMAEDEERFCYPTVNANLCVECGLCHKVCPYENQPERYVEEKAAFGGYLKNGRIRAESTSGGAFSAIAEAYCDENYVIFGAAADGLQVYHTFITDKSLLAKFRKSKYSQSHMGTAYKDVKRFLHDGKKVLFSGTPCQIAGLKAFLRGCDQERLLTVEVICEGVPTPHYVDRYNEWLQTKYGSSIKSLDYRYKDARLLESPIWGKWDFQVMYTSLKSNKTIKKDRWFNPFWSIWLSHLMSRPSCYECPYATVDRNADISLGDLWGVHLYCPELYGHNAGASLVVCNSSKGQQVLKKAEQFLYGHELDFKTALKYQSPMRKHIDMNPNRTEFMKDVQSMEYKSLCKKWAKPPTLKLLYQKYIWGNRQKVWLWNLMHKNKKAEEI